VVVEVSVLVEPASVVVVVAADTAVDATIDSPSVPDAVWIEARSVVPDVPVGLSEMSFMADSTLLASTSSGKLTSLACPHAS